jgi:hypothetical protein
LKRRYVLRTRRIVASVLAIAIEALIYTQMGLLVAVAVMAVLFIAIAINGARNT